MGELVVRTENLVFSYATPQSAVPCIGPTSWEIPAGSFALLMGETGSGKTTLLRQLKPELTPTGTRHGEVQVFGSDPSQWTVAESAQLVGYVAQNPENQAVCSSVWHELAFGLENLGMPQDAMHRRVAEVAHFFGIEPWLNKATDQLSGGQKQTLNLASVLVARPKLLLLDEPTSQLDPVAERNFLHALFRVNRETGITVVVATHRPEAMAHYATCGFRMEEGRVVPASLEEFRCLGGDETAPVVRGRAGGGALGGAAGFEATDGSRGDASCAAAEVATEIVVSLKDAYVGYQGGKDFVLRGADLRIARGNIHALVGGNGCGKTTLLKTLAGILKPRRGKMRNGLSGNQAFLPQDPKALFVRDTVAEEMGEWCPDEAAAADWLSYFGLQDKQASHPYDLSGGQQQLLALAKILACEPVLLLLDEPTKGLDPATKMQVARALVRAADRGCTLVMATHDLSFSLRVADEVSMLFDGQVVCTEDPVSFFAENLFYRPLPDGFGKLWDQENQAEHACVAANSGTFSEAACDDAVVAEGE
ncbi:MAG: ABC transporter ATP-binding protein [Eggerthellaceae bacterium]